MVKPQAGAMAEPQAASMAEPQAARERRRRLAALALVGAAVLTLGAGGWGLARWVNERRIDARLEACSEIIWREAESSALPPDLVRAVIRAESRGRPRAVSPAGAKGLMQVTPIAEREVRQRLALPRGDLFDPDYNIRVGAAYLRRCVERFGGDLYLALAAYHWGPGNVQAIQRKYPGLAGKELIERHAPAVTARYCREVLGGRPVVLPNP